MINQEGDNAPVQDRGTQKVGTGQNQLFSIFFSSGQRPGHVKKVMGQMGYFLLFSVLLQERGT